MELKEVRIHRVILPFRGDFSHSRKEGSSARNIIVQALGDHDEIEGFGEGAPRTYVTGESQESAFEKVIEMVTSKSFPWDLGSVSDVVNFIEKCGDGRRYNSAMCSIEMALLDLLGKIEDKPLLNYFPQSFLCSKVFYGASVPLSNRTRIEEICTLIKHLGIRQVRVKVGKDFVTNEENLELVRKTIGENLELRADANGAWNKAIALEHASLLENHGVQLVEQPLAPDDPEITDVSMAFAEHGIFLMADESACSLTDVEKIIDVGAYHAVNVRLSKLGGLISSLKIVDRLRKERMPFQIGCQLGESGLLSAAGRVLALLCEDADYYDGSYDAFLLQDNITTKDVSFGKGGEAGPLNGPGLGVVVDKEKLGRLSDFSNSVTLKRP